MQVDPHGRLTAAHPAATARPHKGRAPAAAAVRSASGAPERPGRPPAPRRLPAGQGRTAAAPAPARRTAHRRTIQGGSP